ncbi:AraC family transcriptional regulator [Paenibacillus eucommiae]|uniref:AraC-like DNA-binding protein n=1 Tax=Paenibacillus eucommiae TaxID=1355755 RepID=A0ABS4IQQ0_9BACL|nr:AraC family transcriptional regulator [Paenibacillus eucommiae]MBP1989216.1 AraC-like DNA-binding protein [Paenibacillus eucommiae]
MKKFATVHLKGELFFNPHEAVYVNRVVESFQQSQHTHDFLEINYVAEGRGAHYLEEERISSRKGDVFMLPVGTSHIFRPSSTDPKQPFVIYNCLIRPEALLEWKSLDSFPDEFAPFIDLCLQNGPTAIKWLRTEDHTGDFHKLFMNLAQEYTHKRAGYTAIMSGLSQAILGMLFRIHVEDTQDQPYREPLFEEIMQEIKLHYHDSKLSAKELAKKMGIETGRFQKLFKLHNGVSFVAFIQNLRIEHSCQLLRETSYQIHHIAELVGYQDLKFFHALFKRKTGTTPHQFRLAAKKMP